MGSLLPADQASDRFSLTTSLILSIGN